MHYRLVCTTKWRTVHSYMCNTSFPLPTDLPEQQGVTQRAKTQAQNPTDSILRVCVNGNVSHRCSWNMTHKREKQGIQSKVIIISEPQPKYYISDSLLNALELSFVSRNRILREGKKFFKQRARNNSSENAGIGGVSRQCPDNLYRRQWH